MWIVISNPLDIDFIHDDIQGPSCKNWLLLMWMVEALVSFARWKMSQNIHSGKKNHVKINAGFDLIFGHGVHIKWNGEYEEKQNSHYKYTGVNVSNPLFFKSFNS